MIDHAIKAETSVSAIERTTIRTQLPYADLVAAFENEVGRMDQVRAKSLVENQASWSEVEKAMDEMGGSHGLMIITGANQGEMTSLSGQIKKCKLYLVGNPFVANRILQVDLRGSLYVPFRVAIYEEADAPGAAICFDRPSSLLGALGHPGLAEIGAMLDTKIDGVVNALLKA